MVINSNYMKHIYYVLIIALLIWGGVAFAQTYDAREAFTSVLFVNDLDISVPTVVEVSLSNVLFERRGFLVYERETGKLLPSYFRETYAQMPKSFKVTSNNNGDARVLVDGKTDTSAHYSVPLSLLR